MARVAELSGTGPYDEGCEEFTEMFHSTMISYMCHGSPLDIFLNPFWTLISVLYAVMRHTEKVFVIPSASTYSGADGGPHWRDEKKKEAGTCLPPEIPMMFACFHLPACQCYSSSCMMLLLELFPCLAPLY